MKLSLNISEELNSKLETVRRSKGLTKNALVIELLNKSLDNIYMEEKIKSTLLDKISDPNFINGLIQTNIVIDDNKK